MKERKVLRQVWRLFAVFFLLLGASYAVLGHWEQAAESLFAAVVFLALGFPELLRPVAQRTQFSLSPVVVLATTTVLIVVAIAALGVMKDGVEGLILPAAVLSMSLVWIAAVVATARRARHKGPKR